jgi:hypothetical protein
MLCYMHNQKLVKRYYPKNMGVPSVHYVLVLSLPSVVRSILITGPTNLLEIVMSSMKLNQLGICNGKLCSQKKTLKLPSRRMVNVTERI